MPIYTIDIPDWLPARTNEWAWSHWSKYHRLHKAQLEMIGYYAKLCNVPVAIGPRKVSLELTLGPRNKVADRDAFDKLMLDCLNGCGMLIDDSPEYLIGRMDVTFKRGAKRATRIILEDV